MKTAGKLKPDENVFYVETLRRSMNEDDYT